jgi:CheY-like chemotaxis protein
MGGQVSAESTVGVGSRFQVRVSLEPADAAAGLRASQSPDAQAEPRPPGELSGLRVLLVDDSDESRALVQAYLSSTGASLEVATDAAQALAKLHRESFDVILMDLHLPGMDGFSATRELRRTERRSGTVPIPVVALSADALPETVEQALAAGFTEHLAKPLRKAALRALLRRYARSTGARPLLPPSATVSRLRPKFLEHRERDVATIRGALARKDFEIIATLGHNMRGTGVSYGYPEVSAIGGRLEAAAQAKNGRRIDEQIGRLEAWLLRIRNKLAAGRPASSTRVRATRKNQLQTGRTHKGER